MFIQCLGLVEFILQCLHLLADDHQTLSFTLEFSPEDSILRLHHLDVVLTDSPDLT